MARERVAPPTWPDDDEAVASITGRSVRAAVALRRAERPTTAEDLARMKREWATVDVSLVCDWLLARAEEKRHAE